MATSIHFAAPLLLGGLLLLPGSAWAADANPSPTPAVEGVSEGRALLEEAWRARSGGDLRESRARFEAAIELLRAEADEEGLLSGLLNLAETHAQEEHIDAALAAFAEAIGVADRMARRPDSPAPFNGVAARLQLAEMLRAHGRFDASEASAWDALDEALSIGADPLLAPPSRLILLNALSQGATGPELVDLLVELDLAAEALDRYRLHVRPRPEPLVEGIAALGRQLIEAGDPSLAAETFLAVAALDAARGADFRRAEDLSALAFADLQDWRLDAAEWALEYAADLPEAVDRLANACSLAVERGRASDAARACRRAVELASGTPLAGPTASRLATALERTGDRPGAIAARLQAAQAFEASGQLEAARLERSEAAWLGDPASRTLVTAGGNGAPDSPQRLALEGLIVVDELLGAALGGLAEAEAGAVLGQAAAKLQELRLPLLQLGQVDDLLAMAARIAAAQGSDAAALAAREVALGYGDEGWRAALLTGGDPEDGIARLDRLGPAASVPRGPQPGAPGDPQRGWVALEPWTAHESLLCPTADCLAGPRAFALAQAAIAHRRFAAHGLGAAPLLPGAGPNERALAETRSTLAAVRRDLHRASISGSDALRAELSALLVQTREAEQGFVDWLFAAAPLRAELLAVRPLPLKDVALASGETLLLCTGDVLVAVDGTGVRAIRAPLSPLRLADSRGLVGRARDAMEWSRDVFGRLGLQGEVVVIGAPGPATDDVAAALSWGGHAVRRRPSVRVAQAALKPAPLGPEPPPAPLAAALLARAQGQPAVPRRTPPLGVLAGLPVPVAEGEDAARIQDAAATAGYAVSRVLVEGPKKLRVELR